MVHSAGTSIGLTAGLTVLGVVLIALAIGGTVAYVRHRKQQKETASKAESSDEHVATSGITLESQSLDGTSSPLYANNGICNEYQEPGKGAMSDENIHTPTTDVNLYANVPNNKRGNPNPSPKNLSDPENQVCDPELRTSCGHYYNVDGWDNTYTHLGNRGTDTGGHVYADMRR